jgi:hypothetical protein
MDGYYAIGVTHIPYPSFGVIINITSKDDITYVLQLVTSRIAHALTSQKCHPRLWKERIWVYCKYLCYVSRFLCKVDYDSEKFIHAPNVHLQRGHATT